MLAVLLHLRIALPVVAFVERVGEVKAAVRTNPQIVRAVEQLASKIEHQPGHGLVRRDGPELVLLIGAGEQVAALVEVGAVRAARRLEPVGEGSIRRAPLHDAVVRLVGEEDVAVLVHRRAFSEGVATAEFFELGTGGNDGFSGEGCSGRHGQEQGQKAEKVE